MRSIALLCYGDQQAREAVVVPNAADASIVIAYTVYWYYEE